MKELAAELDQFEGSRSTDRFSASSCRLSATYELNTVHIVCAEEPEPSFRSRRMFEELLLLIETNRVNGKPYLPRHLPNLEPLRHSGYPRS
jgi:hypothetical protein